MMQQATQAQPDVVISFAEGGLAAVHDAAGGKVALQVSTLRSKQLMMNRVLHRPGAAGDEGR